MRDIVKLAVSLMIIGVIMPIALGLVATAGDVVINATSGETLSDVADGSIITILTVLVPIIAIISIVMSFLKYGGKNA